MTPQAEVRAMASGLSMDLLKLGQKHTRGKLIVSIAGPGAASVPV